jgi:hypothetical protein
VAAVWGGFGSKVVFEYCWLLHGLTIIVW